MDNVVFMFSTVREWVIEVLLTLQSSRRVDVLNVGVGMPRTPYVLGSSRQQNEAVRGAVSWSPATKRWSRIVWRIEIPSDPSMHVEGHASASCWISLW